MSRIEGHAQIGYASNMKKRYGENAFLKNIEIKEENDNNVKLSISSDGNKNMSATNSKQSKPLEGLSFGEMDSFCHHLQRELSY